MPTLRVDTDSVGALDASTIYLSVAQAADRAGVGYQSAHFWVRQGLIPTREELGADGHVVRYLVRMSDLDAFLALRRGRKPGTKLQAVGA